MAVTEPGPESIILNFDQSDEFTTSATIFSDENQGDQLEVKATSLDKIIQDHQLKHIDFLKVDCEGAEYGILYNTGEEIFKNVSKLAVECHDGDGENENVEALTKYIKGHNFKVHIEGDVIWAWKNE